MSEEPTNYLTIENGVNIINCSSQMPNCHGKNLLTADRKSIWLSAQGLPQNFTIDLTNQIKRPKFYNCFGLDCWHDYASNPSMIELLISTDGDEFITWTVIHPELRAGVQLFQIDPLGTRYNFIKVVIRETYGAPKTYINQIFLFEDNPLKKMTSVSQVNESMSMVNQSNVMHMRKDSAMEDAQYNENFIENFGQGQHLGSNIKPKMIQHSTDDLEVLLNNQNKVQNFNEHQNSLKKRPPSGVIHSSSAAKFDSEQMNQNRFIQNRNDQEYPISQRPPIAMQNPVQSPGLPLYPQQESYEQKMNNMTHESGFYLNPEVNRPRRNSYGNVNANQNLQYSGNEYNQMSFDQQQKPPIGNQARIFASSPARSMQNPNYNRPPYPIVPQNQAYFPQDQLNDSFGSVNDKISNMNDEVKKLAHSKSIRSSEENLRPIVRNNAMDDEEMNLPLLTQSEKEVKHMKKEMQKWSGMMSSLQDNMAKLLTKVGDMQSNMDNVKSKVAHMQGSERGSETGRVEHETRRSGNSAEKSVGERLGTNENFETLRSQITSYLENVMNQNQLIIQENQKLRQNVEQHRSIPPSSSKRVFEKEELEMTNNNQGGWNAVDLEKTISAVFEKSMKAWEGSIFKKIKAQNTTLEERISEKIASEFDNMREENKSFKHKVEEDLKQLRLKVGYLEQANLKATTSELSSYRLSEEQPTNAMEYKRRTKPLLPNKENLAHYQNQSSTKRPTKDVSSVDARKPKAQQLEDSSRDQPLANSSTSSLNKIQNLMDKLNHKIALRDKKVQLLQHQISNPSSQTGKEALNSSGESLEESLFNKKTRNNVSARKKVMK